MKVASLKNPLMPLSFLCLIPKKTDAIKTLRTFVLLASWVVCISFYQKCWHIGFIVF